MTHPFSTRSHYLELLEELCKFLLLLLIPCFEVGQGDEAPLVPHGGKGSLEQQELGHPEVAGLAGAVQRAHALGTVPVDHVESCAGLDQQLGQRDLIIIYLLKQSVFTIIYSTKDSSSAKKT